MSQYSVGVFGSPASYIPPEMTDDLLNLIIKEQEKKFYEESRKRFKDILSHYLSQNEFCGCLLNTLLQLGCLALNSEMP